MSEFEDFPGLDGGELPEAELEGLGLDSERERYKGFPIVQIDWQHPLHATRPDSFYVVTDRGTYGWVPWLGSTVVWPWEAGWVQDLRAEKTVELPKPETKRR